MTWVLVVLAGSLGAVLRYLVSAAVARSVWATAAVNATGTFVLAVAVGASPTGTAPAVLQIGLLGGYTTFSTWVVEAVELAAAGRRGAAVTTIAGQLLAGVVLVGAGVAAGTQLGGG